MQAQQGAQENYGPNNEQLPQELWKELWALLSELERQDDLARRKEVRNILQRRLFFRNDQYWWYSDTQNSWFPPTVLPPGGEQEMPAFQHVTNIFQAFTLSLMSVLSQSTVPSRFWPQSARDEKDVATAQDATKVVDLVHRNNDMQNLADDATYFLCTDGFIGAYVRYVSDGEQFGYDEQEVMEPMEVPMGGDSVDCPNCGWATEGSIDQVPVCPECGAAMQSVPPQMATVPMPTGEMEEIPMGREVVTIVPALQLKRSMWADQQKDFLYLTWIRDVHKATAQDAYQHVSEKISRSAGGETGVAGEVREREARRLLYVGGGQNPGVDTKDLGTFRQVWFRPRAFNLIQKVEAREQLKRLFPHGAYIAFYNDIYCESRDEGMDDKWETMHGMPGEGQVRETLVSALVPIQEQLNDSANMIFEQGMLGAPEKIIDQNLFTKEAREQQVAAPGQETFVNLAPNQDLRSRVLYSQAVEPSQALMAYRAELFSLIPQFLSGVFPALFGGDTGGNDTAQGIAMQRNQALGRIGRVWRRLQIFWANLDAKSVRCFARNRSEDAEIAVLGDGGEYQSQWLALENLQGNVTAYPEIDQQFPVSQAEVRDMLLSRMNAGDPITLALLQEPKNLEYANQRIGLSDLEVPGEAQRKKTYKLIDRMQKEPPLPGPTPDVVLPSIQPDPVVDNLQVALDTAKRWLVSDAGVAAMDNNPAGYANVRAYAMACEQLNKMQQLQQAMVAGAMEGKGPANDLAGTEEEPGQSSASSGSSPSGSQPQTA